MRRIGHSVVLLAAASAAACCTSPRTSDVVGRKVDGMEPTVDVGGGTVKKPGTVLEIAEGVWVIARLSSPSIPVAVCSVSRLSPTQYQELWIVHLTETFPLQDAPAYVFSRVAEEPLDRDHLCGDWAATIGNNRFYVHVVTQSEIDPCPSLPPEEMLR